MFQIKRDKKWNLYKLDNKVVRAEGDEICQNDLGASRKGQARSAGDARLIVEQTGVVCGDARLRVEGL